MRGRRTEERRERLGGALWRVECVPWTVRARCFCVAKRRSCLRWTIKVLTVVRRRRLAGIRPLRRFRLLACLAEASWGRSKVLCSAAGVARSAAALCQSAAHYTKVGEGGVGLEAAEEPTLAAWRRPCEARAWALARMSASAPGSGVSPPRAAVAAPPVMCLGQLVSFRATGA